MKEDASRARVMVIPALFIWLAFTEMLFKESTPLIEEFVAVAKELHSRTGMFFPLLGLVAIVDDNAADGYAGCRAGKLG